MASWAPDEEPPKDSRHEAWGLVILILFILAILFQFTHQTDAVFGIISP